MRIDEAYKPHTQQVKFHQSPAVYRLYGGAKGGGKSVVLLWEAISWCLRVPGCNVLLLRRTYPELKKGLMRHFEILVPPEIYGGRKRYNQAGGFVHFPNGSKLYFGSCQHEKDVMAYNGHEYIFIGIDEATEWPYSMFEYLTFQNRCPIKTWKDDKGVERPIVPCMALASNPGGPGHEWIKALFIGELDADKRNYVRSIAYIKKHIKELESVDEADIRLGDYAFIPAKIFDNPAYKSDKAYLQKLNSANAVWKEKYLYGSWEIFEGAYFEHFDQESNVLGRYVSRRLVLQQPWHPKWIGIDWGFHDHTAVFWFSKVTLTDAEGAKYDVTLCWKELIVKGTGTFDLARLIAKESVLTDNNGRETPIHIQAIYLSPDAWAKRDAENTIAERLGEGLAAYKLPAPSPADNDRIGGARLIDELLSRRPDPELVISEDCTEIIDTLPKLQADPKNPEDVQDTETRISDIYDAFRYGLKSMLGSAKTPFTVERERLMAQCGSNQEKLWTDIALIQRKRAPVQGIRFGRPRYGYGR